MHMTKAMAAFLARHGHHRRRRQRKQNQREAGLQDRCVIACGRRGRRLGWRIATGQWKIQRRVFLQHLSGSRGAERVNILSVKER